MGIHTKIDAGIVGLLQKDPISDMEIKFQKPFDEFSSRNKEILSQRAGKHNIAISNLFKRMGDTHMGIEWISFINIIKAYGFVQAHVYKFKYADVIDPKKVCLEYGTIYYHPVKGLVLWATSWGDMKYLNAGTVYGYLKFPYPIESTPVLGLRGEFILNDVIMTEKIRQATRTLSAVSAKHEPVMMWDDGGTTFSVDVRQALINVLSIIEGQFVFSNPWGKKQDLWMVASTELSNPEYRKLTDERIMACPQVVRNFIKY